MKHHDQMRIKEERDTQDRNKLHEIVQGVGIVIAFGSALLVARCSYLQNDSSDKTVPSAEAHSFYSTPADFYHVNNSPIDNYVRRV